MATIPVWQRSSNYTAVIITGQAVGVGTAAGVLTDGTITATITTTLESLSESVIPEVEEVNGATSTRKNEVILADEFRADLAIIAVNNNNDPMPLRTLIRAYDYLKLTWTEGTSGSQRVVTAYGHRGEFTKGFQGRSSKIIGRLQIGPVDAGADTYVVATP